MNKGIFCYRYPEIIPALSLPVDKKGKIYWKDYETDIERTITSGLKKAVLCYLWQSVGLLH